MWVCTLAVAAKDTDFVAGGSARTRCRPLPADGVAICERHAVKPAAGFGSPVGNQADAGRRSQPVKERSRRPLLLG